MATHILFKNYTAPRIATTNMCAEFRDDLVPPSRPAPFHTKHIQKNKSKKLVIFQFSEKQSYLKAQIVTKFG